MKVGYCLQRKNLDIYLSKLEMYVPKGKLTLDTECELVWIDSRPKKDYVFLATVEELRAFLSEADEDPSILIELLNEVRRG